MKKAVFILILLLIGAFCGRQVLANTYFGSHDGNYMLIRGYVASLLLKDGVFPIRWSGSLQYGCGAPVFNFFYPLFAYIVGGLGAMTGISVVTLMKYLFFFFFLVGPLGMFFLVDRETRDTLASFLAGLLYLLAPYRFVLVFVRGSMEGLGYALLPWVLLGVKLVYEKPKSVSRWAFAILIGAAFFLSHNLVVFFSLPILAVYILYLSKGWKRLRWGLLLVAFWVALTLFFWGPALLEQRYTKLPIQQPQILENLPTLKQLIYSPWSFGPTTPATTARPFPEGMSFSVGFGQWAGLLLAVVVLVILIGRKKKLPLLIPSTLVLALLVIFLDSSLSASVWRTFPFLGLIQFPWRLLGFAVLFTSLSAALALSVIKSPVMRILILLALSGLAFFNVRNYMGANPAMHPEIYAELDKHFNRYSTTTVSDEILPADQASACAVGYEWIEGQGITLIKRQFEETGGTITFSSETDHATSIRLPLSYFPGIYSLWLNGQAVNFTHSSGFVLLPHVQVKPGQNQIIWKIHGSPLEHAFTLISFVSLILSLLFILGLLWYLSSLKKSN